MILRVLDPTNEANIADTRPALRSTTLAGKTVGIVSNGKEGTKTYFSHLSRLLKHDLGVGNVVICVKSNYSAPADAWIAEEMRRWDAVVAGIGD